MDNISIGKKITQIRDEHGLTQEQLAQMMGVSTSFISQIELGKSAMGAFVLISKANKFDAHVISPTDAAQNGENKKSAAVYAELMRLFKKDVSA